MNTITNDEAQCAVVLDALLEVIDPEIGLNVVDLGLIYQVDFDDNQNKIYCTMTLTTQFCPMGESIQSGVQRAIENTFPERSVNVNVIFDPPWNATMISEEGREFLNS